MPLLHAPGSSLAWTERPSPFQPGMRDFHASWDRKKPENRSFSLLFCLAFVGGRDQREKPNSAVDLRLSREETLLFQSCFLPNFQGKAPRPRVRERGKEPAPTCLARTEPRLLGPLPALPPQTASPFLSRYPLFSQINLQAQPGTRIPRSRDNLSVPPCDRCPVSTGSFWGVFPGKTGCFSPENEMIP